MVLFLFVNVMAVLGLYCSMLAFFLLQQVGAAV